MDFVANGDAGNGELVPFTLTLVHYQHGDWIGLGMAAITLTPIFMVVSYVTLIVALRFPTRLVLLFVGQLVNVVLNVTIKHFWKDLRPQGKSHLVHFGRYGMPSNHTQFMFFVATFALLNAIYGTKRGQNVAIPYQIPLALLCIVLAPLVAISRIYLEYHTVMQVIVGACVGTVFGAIWFKFLLTIFPEPLPKKE